MYYARMLVIYVCILCTKRATLMQPGAFVNSDMPVGRMASPSPAYLCIRLHTQRIFVFRALCICIESEVYDAAHIIWHIVTALCG